MHPLLALVLVVAAGIGVIHLSLPSVRRPAAIDGVIAAGLPFLLIGALLGPGLRVLDDAAMRALTPLTALGLGWIGAIAGADFPWRLVRRIPRREALAAAALAGAAFVASAAVAAVLARFVAPIGSAWRGGSSGSVLPAVLALGAIGTAAVSTRGGAVRRVTLVATGLGIVGFAIVVAMYRPEGMSIGGGFVRLTAMAGLGAAVGLLAIWLARLRDGTEGMEPRLEVVAVLLAGAGLGLVTGLSPFIICAVAGAVLASRAPVFPSPSVQLARRLLPRWSFGLYAIVLVLAGAMLRIPTWWLLPAALALGVARVGTRWLLLRLGRGWALFTPLPPNAWRDGIGAGPTAVGLALSFELAFRPAGSAIGGGAILATVLLGVLLAQAVASALAGSAARSAPLTAAPPRAEVT